MEGYVDEILDELVRREPLGSKFAQAMFVELKSDFHRNWPGRFHWLRQGFDVDIADTPSGAQLWDLVELRNALVHGGGKLTGLQSADLVKRLNLERRLLASLDVRTSGRLVQFGDNTAARSVSIARAATVSLDGQLPFP